jgi:hypothetical protein
MNQPVYWSVLAGIAVLAAAARLTAGGPLLRCRAVPLGRGDFLVAVVSVLALAFHCAVMFFAPWTDAVPGADVLGSRIRALGPVSQWTYWLPAAALALSLRRVWWPALVSLTATLSGVGITMFWPYPLTTHLAWLAAAVVTWIVVASSLVGRRQGSRPPREPAPAT